MISKSSKIESNKDKVKSETVSPSKKVPESPSKKVSESPSKTVPERPSKKAPESPSKKVPESTVKIPTPSGSPSSSSTSGDFHGFQELKDSNELLKRKEAFGRFLSSLEDVGEERNSEGENMTAEEADAADSDSNQMEIDEGNSRADSTEFDERNEKGRTKDSDVDVMETDSVKSGENAPAKTEEEVKTVTKTAAEPESEPQAKVEYCGTCSEVVDDAEEGICCDGKCERWFHLQCSGLTQAEYDELSRDENAKWACSRCSGKPPPEIKPGAKPLLTVRKDLTAIETATPKRKMPSKEEKRPRVDISNPIFLKPFDYGWKRELVYRSTTDSQNKKQGDVYYYTPKGKKLRSLREISEHLIGTDLTVDNFTFWKDAIGCDSDKEIIRDAKIKLGNRDSIASPAPVAKKVATPKTPKATKTTPKLTATVTPLDSASGLPVVAKASASVTPRVVLKSGKTGSVSAGPKIKVTPKTTTPGQTQKVVITKGADQSVGLQPSKNIDVSKNDARSSDVEIYSTNETNPLTNVVPGNSVDEVEDIDIVPKNKFRRYGLLANRISTRNSARKKRTKSSSSSSSSGAEEFSSPEIEIRASLMSQLNSMKEGGFKPKENHEPSKKITDNLVHPSRPTPIVTSKPLLTSDTVILPNSKLKRPRSPELQFRPSDPSSYGCQTNRPVGPNVSGMSSSFCHPFETVLIVDTQTESIVNSPKRNRPTHQYKSPSPVQWTHDCSIEVLSVETLPCRDGFPNMVASPSKQAGLLAKKQSSFIRTLESNRNGQSALAKSNNECSPISVASSSTDVVVIEEDGCDNSLPPFLMRNSSPPELKRRTDSPTHSPPSLQANASQHPATQSTTTAGNLPLITIHSTSSLSSSQGTPESSGSGTKFDEYRRRKRERFYERNKARQEMERLKKSYLKERRLFIKRKSDEKKLQIKYLQLKVRMKAMKLSIMKKKIVPEEIVL